MYSVIAGTCAYTASSRKPSIFMGVVMRVARTVVAPV